MTLFTQKMKMLTAVVIAEKTDDVVKALLKEGVMDFVSLSELNEKEVNKLEKYTSKIPKAVISDLRSRTEATLRSGSISIPSLDSIDLTKLDKLNVEEYKKLLDRLSGSISSKKEEQRVLSQKLLSYQELEKYIKEKKDEYLDLRVGNLEKSKVEDLKRRLAILNGLFFALDDNNYVSLTLKRDAARVNELFDKFSWLEADNKELQRSAYKECLPNASERVGFYQESVDKIIEQYKEKIKAKEDELTKMFITLRVSELATSATSYFAHTKNTTLFSGWVPEVACSNIERVIYEESDGKCIIQWTSDKDVDREKVPVSLSSPSFLAPFERLVKNYSTPEYGSINPTPFATICYVVMFALMFADLGQGLVLLLIGLIGTQYYKKNPLAKDSLISRYLCSLLLYLGPASMVGGLLFGSTFGYSLIPAIWFNYHKVVNGHAEGSLVTSVYDILGITIKFGIVVIFTGLILNWINLFRKKRYLTLLLDKNGLVGGVLYAVGIYACFYFVSTDYKSFPTSPILLYLIVIPLILLFLKGPIEVYLERKHGHKEKMSQVIIDVIMDFLVEVLEVFSGFLSNTLSFMRVAGLGIAHVSLMTAFEEMSKMPNNILFEILIMIVGNVLVIAIEGLSAGIQSLRLNYYEFFTKYFTGRGIAYKPIGLKSKSTID